MQENVIQSIGNRQQQLRHYDNYSLDDVFSRKASAVVQPMPIHPVIHTHEKENQPVKPIGVSPVLPGTKSVTHNITRMLEASSPLKGQLPSTPGSVPSFTPYSTAHLLSFQHSALHAYEEQHKTSSFKDMTHDNHGNMRSGDLSDMTDSSFSTLGSNSPQSRRSCTSPSGSTNSSPGSGCGSITSPEITDSQSTKKKSRTNYTPDQVRTLEKIFHENPYPESEMMESIGKDLNVPENKIKVWFQNKRARWRRRNNDNVNAFPQQFMPMPQMMSPVSPYGFIPQGRLMTSSPPHIMPGYLNYSGTSGMQGSPNTNNNQLFGHCTVQTKMSPQSIDHLYNQQHLFGPSSTTSPSSISPSSVRATTMASQQFKHLSNAPFLYPSPPYPPISH